MADAALDEIQPKQEWVKKFTAEEQARADALGMNIIEYQMQAEGGILKPTILKMLRHAKVHPNQCPEDCAFKTSFNKLKEKYRVR